MRPVIDIPKPLQSRLRVLLDAILNTLGLISIISLIAKFGFELRPEVSLFLTESVRAVMWLFVGQEVVRYLFVSGLVRQLRERILETALAVLTLFYLFFSAQVQGFVQLLIPDLSISNVTLVYLGLTQTFVLFTQVLKSFRNSTAFSSIKLNPSRLFLMSFVLAIAMGTLLLKLPKATVVPISWMDALFTATSAICVTGLLTVDFASQMTPLGQFVVCMLIQIGGLGIMTFSMTFALFLSGGLGVRDRMFIADLISEERLGEVGRLLVQIIVFTLTIEFFGAIGLYYAQGGSFSNFDVEAFYFAGFHAISAFCNAGISLFSEGFMAEPVRNNKPFLSVIMCLIVIGGLGFPVLRNLFDVARGRRPKVRNLFLTVPTKLILLSTIVLIVGGTLLVLLAEQGAGFRNLGNVDKLFQSLFLSITSRTAGFNIWPTEELTVSAMVAVMILMWVGGSPMSTAGGIKNLTLMVALLNVRSVLTSQTIQVFGRHISSRSTVRAFAVITLSLMGIMFTALLLVFLEPNLPVGALVFETVSAWGTVGLSRGVTPLLSDSSKLLLVVSMLIGRLGLLTFFIGFMRPESEVRYRLVDENIPIS